MEAVIKIHAEASKWEIRQKVWDYIEAKNLANFPRPVHNRIPNFKGADRACAHVSNLEIFHRTSEIKVGPDKPLEGARLAVLQAGKTLLVPTPRLRTGLLNKIVPPEGASRADLRACSTSQGVKEYSVPIGLDAKITVDLVVVGSVAVSEKGYRIGKGEGYSDMEYAMMVSVGAVKNPLVVSVVHDCQVMDIPEDLIESHDLTVDYILTPTRVIRTECKHPKPQGIIWAKLNADMLEKIPILKKLRTLERQAGRDVTLGRASAGGEAEAERDGADGEDRAPQEEQQQEQQQAISSVYLGGIPAGLRVSELKCALRERGAAPLRLNWQGALHRAFLDYSDGPAAEAALLALGGLSLNGKGVQVELAKSRRGGRKKAGQARGRAGATARAQTGTGTGTRAVT
ncbi:methenyltetrahydrofolate synthase domain-containing protein [Anguilla rostrata]|uniref:methenyltetrahydrofolate synthase domain-containing protein n=1 Tax=Anguilla rostrata TaxID=7938 RepID=UPI0030CC3A5A